MIFGSFLVKFDGSGSKMHEIHWFLAMCWVPEAVGAPKNQFEKIFSLIPYDFFLGVEGDPQVGGPCML